VKKNTRKVLTDWLLLDLSLYRDYQSVLRSQKGDMLKEGNNENRTQRYRAALGKTQRLLEEIKAHLMEK